MNECIVSLLNPDHLKISDYLGSSSFGCDQEWYKSKWKRMAGCGPSVASNVLIYLHRSKKIDILTNLNDKSDCMNLMESVWHHVTPGFKGVHLLRQFDKGIYSYSKSKGFELKSFSLDISKKKTDRPGLFTMVEFIRQGLASDTPVAFLNLSSGMVKNLDSWHWVTIVSIKAGEQNDTVSVQVYDGAKAFEVDLRLWLETTTVGGGFIYFI